MNSFNSAGLYLHPYIHSVRICKHKAGIYSLGLGWCVCKHGASLLPLCSWEQSISTSLPVHKCSYNSCRLMHMHMKSVTIYILYWHPRGSGLNLIIYAVVSLQRGYSHLIDREIPLVFVNSVLRFLPHALSATTSHTFPVYKDSR